MIEKYLPQILNFIGILITAYGGIRKTKPATQQKFYNNSVVCIFFGLLLSFIGTVISTVRENESKYVMNSYITGGDGYGAVNIHGVMKDKTYKQWLYILSFENMGKYPLYDVEIDVLDPEYSKKAANHVVTIDDLKQPRKIKIGNVVVDNFKHDISPLIEPFELLDNDIKKFDFIISTKNGFFYEKMRIAKINGNISVARNVSTISHNANEKTKVLLNEIDNTFPRKIDGQIQW